MRTGCAAPRTSRPARWAGSLPSCNSEQRGRRDDRVVDREAFTALVDRGLTQRQIATALGCSQTTVRYWLRRWGIQTRSAAQALRARSARAAGVQRLERDCRRHGPSSFVLDAEGIY